MLDKNGVPLLAIIIVLVPAVAFTIISIMLFKKYVKRPNAPVLFLGLSMLSYGVSAYVNWVGILVEYLGGRINPMVSNLFFTAMIEFIFIALGNVFLIVFMTTVYLDANNQVLIIFTSLNSLAIGLFIPNLFKQELSIDDVKVGFIYFIVVSLLTYGLFIYKNEVAIKSTTNKNMIMGFRFMQFFGLTIILSFVSFVINMRFIILHKFLFNPFYYLGYVTFAITAVLAYLGFILPSKLLRKE